MILQGDLSLRNFNNAVEYDEFVTSDGAHGAVEISQRGWLWKPGMVYHSGATRLVSFRIWLSMFGVIVGHSHVAWSRMS